MLKLFLSFFVFRSALSRYDYYDYVSVYVLWYEGSLSAVSSISYLFRLSSSSMLKLRFRRRMLHFLRPKLICHRTKPSAFHQLKSPSLLRRLKARERKILCWPKSRFRWFFLERLLFTFILQSFVFIHLITNPIRLSNDSLPLNKVRLFVRRFV